MDAGGWVMDAGGWVMDAGSRPIPRVATRKVRCGITKYLLWQDKTSVVARGKGDPYPHTCAPPPAPKMCGQRPRVLTRAPPRPRPKCAIRDFYRRQIVTQARRGRN